METGSDSLEEQLNRFEADIRQLKIEYEQYFGGGRKRPPADIEWRIDLVVKRYGDRGAQMNFAQRFRFSNLTQTYARFREIFHKRMRKREEGTVERHFGAAARAVAAERSRAARAKISKPVVIACSDPEREPKKMDQLYTAFREALERTGESTEKFSRDAFERFLKQKSQQLREQKESATVEYVISVEGGKARLKARTSS